MPPTDWPAKLSALRALPSTTYVSLLHSFTPPSPGNILPLQHRRFLITRSQGVDGVVLGVAPHRRSCLVCVELPGNSAVAVIADAPVMLELLVKDVFEVLGQGFAITAP